MGETFSTDGMILVTGAVGVGMTVTLPGESNKPYTTKMESAMQGIPHYISDPNVSATTDAAKSSKGTVTAASASDPTASDQAGTQESASGNGEQKPDPTVSHSDGDDSATASPTSTSPSSLVVEQRYRGLPDGAVAGVAIACVVLGLALGAIAGIILLKRRRRQPQPQASVNQVTHEAQEPKNDVMVAVTSSRSDTDLDQFLLDTVPDKQIEGELHSLSELIYQHVESHYHRSPVHLDAQALVQSLVHIGYSPASSGLDAVTVAALCLEPSTRQVGLRHVLSHAIFSSLDFSRGGSMSMLPPVVREFLSTIPSSADTTPASSLALSKWRTLSTLLLHPTPADRTPLPVPVAEASKQAADLANELNTTLLRFFAAQDGSSSSQEQTGHLQAVILECAKLGYALLSQPSDWRFVFSGQQQSRRVVVVCPGLEKLSHSDGTRYMSPKEVVAVATMPV